MKSEDPSKKNKINILIVDDYDKNIEVLSELISSDEVNIFSASSANECLEHIAERDFGLLLLDVQMPNVNGFELAKVIRSVRKFRSIPIIFVTAHREDSNYVFEGYKSGAVDLLFKPLNPDMVRAKVQIFVDLAQQKLQLQSQVSELEKLRFDAEAANIAKSQFLANMSHEIRTPLAAVMGFTDLLCQKLSHSKEDTELKKAIDRNGTLLLKLIDDILDLTKVETNKLELDNRNFNLKELIQDIRSTLTYKAIEKHLNLIIHDPQNCANDYCSDPTRIKQVLLNIIGNAIKFTAKGNVVVQFEKVASDSSGDSFRILVEDQGVGLSPDQVAKLFRPFVQADSSTRRHFGGSGLGLVISRQIAKAMGGDLKLKKSAPGVGSVFEIQLKLQRVNISVNPTPIAEAQKATPPTPPQTFPDRSILVVDDSPDNLTMVGLFLKGTGVQLAMAENGLRAIDMVGERDFDLILMDVQMPKMDGHEATRHIRDRGFEKPIVALTAHAIKAEKERCLQSGCNSVITKPVSRTRLLEEIVKYFG